MPRTRSVPPPTVVRGDSIVFDGGPVRPDELARLYNVVGWHVVPEENFRRALAGTYVSIAARCQGELVGYGRALADGGVHSWIHDLIVVPEFRHQGIGGHILRGLIDRLRDDGIPYIGLFAAKDRASFYEGFGFKRRPDDAPGMYLYLLPD